MSAAPLPRDGRLRHLAKVLDVEHMALTFQQHLFADGSQAPRIADCRIQRVKYKPTRNCLVCYDLELEDPRDGRRHRQLLCGRTYEAGGSATRFHKALADPGVTPRYGRSVMHVEELDMVLWSFPNERKLRGLPLLNDRQRLARECLPRLLRCRWWDRWRLREFEHRLVHYVPEHTCSVRLDLALEDGRGGSRDWTLFGKTYYDEEGARTHRNMLALQRRSAAPESRLISAPVLLYDPDWNLLWQEGLDALSLQELEQAGRLGPAALRRAAAALAELHHSRLPATPRPGLPRYLTAVRRSLDVLGLARPTLARRLGHWFHRLALTAPVEQRLATLHGDLHAKNLLDAGEAAALIDLDNLHRGAPAKDLGSWLAGRYYRACLNGPAPSLAELFDDPLLVHYRSAADAPPGDAELRWYTAAALIHERAYRCLTRLKAGRLQVLESLLGGAESLLARHRRPGR